MGLITSAGIGSGIDLESIIEALVTAERRPKEISLNRLEQRTNTTLSGLGKLQSALSNLEDSLANLTEANFRTRTATSSNESQLTASANYLASETNFAVTINQTATYTELSTNVIAGDATTQLGAGNLTFNSTGGETFSVAVGATDSLADIVYAINNKSDNFGISATLVNGDSGTKIIYRGIDTGDNADFTVTNDNANLAQISDGNGGALNVDSTAQNASITVSGLTISSETNTFNNPVQGVDLTLADDAVAGTVNVNVTKDKQAVKDNIQEFVDNYNAFIQIANQLGSAQDGAEGELLGDSTLRNIVRQVTSQISNTVGSANPDFNTLSRIGITTERDGTLSIDSTELDSILNSNFDAVGTVFYATDGIGTSISTAITPYEQLAGLIDKREESLQSILSQIQTDRDNLDYRINALEESLRSKFAAVDSLVSQFNFTGTYLEQQFAALSAKQSG
ncbi:MAG: flagellar filament capping protein FliD [Gammaproteobacteria bacterium]|nr:flagellar filament capping protein FliD [Gammaproteobacteria bacterium]